MLCCIFFTGNIFLTSLLFKFSGAVDLKSVQLLGNSYKEKVSIQGNTIVKIWAFKSLFGCLTNQALILL